MYVDEKTKERKEIADEKELYKKFNLVDDDEHMLILYSFGIVEDDIYVVLDYGEHYPQEDIGWRYAYTCFSPFDLLYGMFPSNK